MLTRPGATLSHVLPSRRVHHSETWVTLPSFSTHLVCQYLPELAGLDPAVVAAASMTCRPDRTGSYYASGADRSETTAAAAAVSPTPAAIQRFLRLGLTGPPRIVFWSRCRLRFTVSVDGSGPAVAAPDLDSGAVDHSGAAHSSARIAYERPSSHPLVRWRESFTVCCSRRIPTRSISRHEGSLS